MFKAGLQFVCYACSTCVAGITHWQSDNGIRFCSMDLGGDDVYRVLHQYFLDKDALFILAYDHRKFTGHVSQSKLITPLSSNKILYVRKPSYMYMINVYAVTYLAKTKME